jgi:hypothetical protein
MEDGELIVSSSAENLTNALTLLGIKRMKLLVKLDAGFGYTS